ncbi:MAG: sigma-70 family RNA polymerase sigma factor [Pirellulaceae bacterium]
MHLVAQQKTTDPCVYPATLEKARELLTVEIEFIDNALFRTADAEREILGVTAIDDEPFTPQAPAKTSDFPAHLARLCDAALLSAEDERTLFRRMNYLKFRANQLRSRLRGDDPQEQLVCEIEALLAQATQTRDRIVRANMRLVIAIVKKFVAPGSSFDDLLSDGIMTLMSAVEKFDYDRGFRFSTYAYRSIARSAYRRIVDRNKEMSRYSAVPEDWIEDSLEDRGASSMNESTWETLRGMMADFLERLDEREQLIVRARYALGRQRTVQTFQSIADKLGVSKERVRQLEQRAVAKLRAMALQSQSEPAV